LLEIICTVKEHKVGRRELQKEILESSSSSNEIKVTLRTEMLIKLHRTHHRRQSRLNRMAFKNRSPSIYEQYLVELDFFFVSLLTDVTRKAVPWLGLARHVPGIGNRLVDVGFVVDQVPVGEVCLRALQFILIYKSKHDARVTEFILPDNRSACFGRYYHSSSGAQNNCNYSIW
jgi:hypothetical protein